MIKTTLITIAALSTTAGATLAPDTVMPSAVNLTAGALSLQTGPTGAKFALTAKPDFALAMTTQSGRTITIRF